MHAGIGIMTTTTMHVDHERMRRAAWAAVVFAVLALFALVAQTLWATQPLTLLILPAPFAGLLILLVSLSDYVSEHART